MKEAIEWLFGPQAMGLIFLFFGYLQKVYPPKKINGYYGYSSPASQKNQETWDEANRYAAGKMLFIGVVLVAGGVLLTVLIKTLDMHPKSSMMMFIISVIIAGASLRSATERHLTKVFGNHEQA